MPLPSWITQAFAKNASAASRHNPSKCPVCAGTLFEPSAKKFGVQYWFCAICAVIFSGDLDPEVVETQNSNPEERADPAVQAVKVQRILQNLGRPPEKILDFGCGQGEFVDFLKNAGLPAWGVDQDTKLKLSDFAPQSIDVINMVEVIEHLNDPNRVLQKLTNLLKPDGIIYLESSFVDFLGDPAQSDYVDPRIGHCCIHSRRSINYLAVKFKMRHTWINNSVLVMHKGLGISQA